MTAVFLGHTSTKQQGYSSFLKETWGLGRGLNSCQTFDNVWSTNPIPQPFPRILFHTGNDFTNTAQASR